MKRDWDVIRSILQRIEEEKGLQFQLYPKDFEPIDNDEAVYHLRLLYSAGLIEGFKRDSISTPPSFVATGITWEGHELLSSMKSVNVWGTVKDTARKKGLDLSLETIKILVRVALETMLK